MDYSNICRLDGKKALVTGGTGGLGSEIALAFLDAGADVAVCGSNEKKAEPLIAHAKETGRKCIFIQCNICSEEEVNSMMDEIAAQFGTLDIVVNSAGMNRLLPAEDYDTETFQKVMDLNVTAMFRVTREAGKRFFIPQLSGKVLNISSVKSLIGTDKDYIAYCTSKGAVNMYTRQLACEWGRYGINCNAIAPTFVRTPINAFQLDDPEFYKCLTERIPLGRIGQKSDIASASLFLCSSAASFIRGQILCVDGGLTAKQ